MITLWRSLNNIYIYLLIYLADNFIQSSLQMREHFVKRSEKCIVHKTRISDYIRSCTYKIIHTLVFILFYLTLCICVFIIYYLYVYLETIYPKRLKQNTKVKSDHITESYIHLIHSYIWESIIKSIILKYQID